LKPEFSQAHEALAVVFEMAGMPDQAFAEYQKYLITGGAEAEEVSAFERAYHSGGIRAYLQKLLGKERDDERRGNGVWPLKRASLYARLGDTENAVQWLERAFRERVPHLTDIFVEPMYDSLRKDPQFSKLIERLQPPASAKEAVTQR
jgi:hypothetical protein